MRTASRSIPFVDLVSLHGEIREELTQAFDRVVGSGAFTLGAEVEAFEAAFAANAGTTYAIGVGTGTDALHLALRACGVEPGDEVITADNTFAATVEAILMCGARPVLVDVEEPTHLMDLDAAEAAITERTRVIVPVHLYGQMVDMRRVRSIAQSRGIKVIEDACQAHGAVRDCVNAGAGGDAGCFSFYPGKNLGALGDGGMVVTDDSEIARKVRLLRNHGEDAQRLHVVPGYCSRLHGLQAALLATKLPHLEAWNRRRRAAAAAYDRALAGIPIGLPTVVRGSTHVYHLYVVRVKEREAVRGALAARGIQTAIHYATPLHLEPAFEQLGYRLGEFPVAEQLASQIVSLPMHPCLETEDVEDVARVLEEVAHG